MPFTDLPLVEETGRFNVALREDPAKKIKPDWGMYLGESFSTDSSDQEVDV